MDPNQDGSLWPDGSVFEVDAGPGRQPEWIEDNAEDTEQSEQRQAKQLLTLHELTPEPDPNLLMQQYFQSSFQEFHLGNLEMDMPAFFDMQASQPAWTGYQKDEAWRWDRERRYYNRPSTYQPTSRDDPPQKAAKAGKELRALLDFYFEPFNLQHNKFMLDLILAKVGATFEPGKVGERPRQALLSKNTLAELRFDVEELKGLNRLYAGFERLEYGRCEMVALDDPGGAGFKVKRRWAKTGTPVEFHFDNLRYTTSGEFMMRKLAEVRSFQAKEEVDLDELLSHFMTPPGEEKEAPKDKFSIVSLNCSGVRERSVPEESLQSTEGRIRRQIMLYPADIICIQGLDPWTGPVGFRLASSLMEFGYQVAAHSGHVEKCNTVFFHEKCFELVSTAFVVASADLKFLEADGPTIRVACIRAQVPPSLDFRQLLDQEQAKALVIVADCEALGGTAVLHTVQELAEMRSAYRELAKEEVSTPLGQYDPLASCQRAVTIGPSQLLKLHRPDCMLYNGAIDAVATLAGHSAMYLATLSAEEASAQLPTLRMPLLSVFQLKDSS